MKILKKLSNKFGLTKTSPDVGIYNELNRNRWIKNSLKNISNGKKILDAGAGEQQYKKYCGHLNYVSQDFAEYNGKGDSGLQTGEWHYGKLDIISDILNIPEKDETFDAILCSEVIEHIPDPVKVFPEFNRLLKKGGDLFLTAPFCSLTHFAPYHYSTGFSKFFYEKHLNENGFEIITLDFNGNYFEYLAQELRRLPYISEKYTGVNIKAKLDRPIKNILNSLDILSSNGDSSKELLCFGIHIHAKKR